MNRFSGQENNMKQKFFTDYPFVALGDASGLEAPIREIVVLSYDGGLYCNVAPCGYEFVEPIKAGYIYQAKGRFGEVPGISSDQLIALPFFSQLKFGIYHLEKNSPADYDEMDGCIVVAYSKKEARRLASQCKGAEGKDVWLSPKRSSCRHIGTPNTKVQYGVLIRDCYES